MTRKDQRDPILSIGVVARRTGVSVSAVRFYADEGLIPVIRSDSGHRVFVRSVIRRIAFILISQKLGYSLNHIRHVLANLPNHRTPTKADWQALSQSFSTDIDQRISDLQQLRTKLTGCIGCGCLSLETCHLYNENDKAAQNGGADLYYGESGTRT